ncbi:hypothetical protein CEXT_313931 [Caerostris extrusa]|uniref:Uncharacterized protein n=1 Tax=Caerostris extrusa TaxID=172846 RepID=A0AAV4MSB3_CAEEX|nr:hypothetical protein CEXT_313931 [Caerostris extrusa]
MMERLPGIKDAAERMGDICEKICLQGRCVMEEQQQTKWMHLYDANLSSDAFKALKAKLIGSSQAHGPIH